MLLKIASSFIKRPKLLRLLLASYKNYLIKEFSDVLQAMKIRFILYGLSFVFCVLGLSSAMGSILLWAALPILNPQHAWLMMVLPLALLAVSLLFFILGNRLKIQLNFIAMRKKIKSDTQRICQSLI